MLLALEPDKNNDHLLVDPLLLFLCVFTVTSFGRSTSSLQPLSSLVRFLVRHEFVFFFFLFVGNGIDKRQKKMRRETMVMPVNRSRCIM